MDKPELLKTYKRRLQKKYEALADLEIAVTERVEEFTAEEKITLNEIRERDLREIDVLESTIKYLEGIGNEHKTIES